VNEAQIVERYFRPLGVARADVLLGIGDDAAVLAPPPGMALVMTTDSLVEGAHFLPGASPHSLGHRALAVNLSDCAAMGARPLWALLSLVLPRADGSWLAQFAAGMAAQLRAHGVALVGGNLARGPLAITVQLTGAVAPGQALRRDRAQPGDQLFVTGTLGDAAAGRAAQDNRMSGSDSNRQALIRRFEYPEARVALGRRLPGLASACIDLSDGLLTDLPRLLQASNLNCELELQRLPVSEPLQAVAGSGAALVALRGGEDYELLIAAAPQHRVALLSAAADSGTPLTQIASLAAGTGSEPRLRLRDATGCNLEFTHDLIPADGERIDHFAG
jgi:thiamine-monophosphate kinase